MFCVHWYTVTVAGQETGSYDVIKVRQTRELSMQNGRLCFHVFFLQNWISWSRRGWMFNFVSIFRQCALTLGQLCDSRVVLGTLQTHCQDALRYRVPRDAPSNVDLGAYMFRQTDEFRVSGGGLHRQVATIVSISLFLSC